MRTLIIAFCLGAATAPAFAQAVIQPSEAKAHVGQAVTVEGLVSDVHHAASGRATFIDMGGRYPDNTFAAVIFSRNAVKFSGIDSLSGKTIDVSGTIRLYRGTPEVIVDNPAQIKIK